MPTDDFGNVADIVCYDKGAISRLNPGQFYEQFINACSRDITLDIRAMMDKGDMAGAWAHFIQYITIMAPKTLEFVSTETDVEHQAVLDGIYKEGIYLYIPADDPNFNLGMYGKMAEWRLPNKTPVTFTDIMGKVCRTRRPVLIGPVEIMVLDKLDHKPMAVSGILRQHHGLPAVQNKGTKHARPSKEQPVRCVGESESRALSAIMGGEKTAELMRLATNPTVHKDTMSAIFNAKDPAKIDSVKPKGNHSSVLGRPVSFVKHLMNCSGIEMVDDTDNINSK